MEENKGPQAEEPVNKCVKEKRTKQQLEAFKAAFIELLEEFRNFFEYQFHLSIV
jgi:hypothetical protein